MNYILYISKTLKSSDDDFIGAGLVRTTLSFVSHHFSSFELEFVLAHFQIKRDEKVAFRISIFPNFFFQPHIHEMF
jgi:hypothetical protein